MKDDRNHGAPRTRRWMSQRWLVDNVIRSVGVDWDQPRSINYNAPCGPDVALRREQREKCRAERTEARVLRAIREPRRSQVEAAWVPYQSKALPGWFHLPSGYAGGRIPAVVAIPGMDGFKEAGVAMYGDRWLSRGIAVLTIEGRGSTRAARLHG